MLVESVRYCLTRKTYVGPRITRTFRDQWDNLTPGIRNVMARDVSESTGTAKQHEQNPPRNDTEREWDELMHWIEAEVRRRRERAPCPRNAAVLTRKKPLPTPPEHLL